MSSSNWPYNGTYSQFQTHDHSVGSCNLHHGDQVPHKSAQVASRSTFILPLKVAHTILNNEFYAIYVQIPFSELLLIYTAVILRA